MNISQVVAEFVSGLTIGDLPEEIKRNVNIRIMDLVTSAVAGNRINHPMNSVVLQVLEQQGGYRQSSLLFQKQGLPAAQAAFYNAFVSHGADMDDGHMLANGHPGVCVIPPVLALAEWRTRRFVDIATAIVAVYVVYIRLSNAIMPSHLQRGFHGTGTVGSVAAAAAAARVLRLDAQKTHNAIGLAATSAAGLMELNESGQAMKPINPGNAAYSGVICAVFTEAGGGAPTAPFDGNKGFFKAFADDVAPGELTENLGKIFLIDTSYIKRYPACRHLHAMVDCAIEIHDEGGFLPQDIERIKLYTYPTSEKMTGIIRHPKSEDEAKFSLTYATATALVKANFTLGDLMCAAETGPDVASLIDRMEIVVCPELEDRKRQVRGARLEVVLKNGEMRASEVEVPKGEKRFPLTQEDMRKKLEACAEGVLTAETQKRIVDTTMQFEAITDLSAYFTLLAGEK
jgi:2-methylcitrate dehydratase PrpD